MFCDEELRLLENKPDIRYHLQELDIVKSADSRLRYFPDLHKDELFVLDVGCGIGQGLYSLPFRSDVRYVGIDISCDAVSYGLIAFPQFNFVCCKAECIFLPSCYFDFVYSRVTLPYTKINHALEEIYRVCKPGARVWFSFHGFVREFKSLLNDVFKIRFRSICSRIFRIFNGLLFVSFGFVVRNPITGSVASCQTRGSIRRMMKKKGYVDIVFPHKDRFVVCGRVPPA